MLILTDITLYPFGLSADQIVWWGFVAGVVAAVGVIVTIILTIYFGRKSLSKADLAPLEGHLSHIEEVRSNTARMDKRLHRQEELDNLAAKARRVSISVSGQNDSATPLQVLLTIKDTNVVLTRLELFNEVNNVFGEVDCERLDELTFQSIIDPMTVRRWIGGGTTAQMVNRVRVILRVYMSIGGDENEVYREMAVHLNDGMKRDDQSSQMRATVTIDGSV